MNKTLPEISKQVSSQDIIEVLEKKFISITPVWVPSQMAWMNNVYKTFHDYKKFMIVMHLLMKTFEVYSRNFSKLNYEEYFSQYEIEIDTINVMEISQSLNIPKETTRRKINELEKLGTIKRINRKFIIDRNTWPSIKPEETIKRMSRFLSTIIFLFILLIAPISSNSLIFLLVVSLGILRDFDISVILISFISTFV